jgi:hypothetical protein
MPSTPRLPDLIGGDINEFGSLPREEHVRQSLEKPNAPGALKIGSINNITKARIRYAMSQLVALELEHIQTALRDLQTESPKAYLETVMELMTFSLPKLKSVEIDVSANNENARNMSIADLQSALTSQDVVSTQ